MTADASQHVHGTVVVVGEVGVLIRGPSGAGKSSLAARLIADGERAGLFVRLVGDDRIALTASGGRLIARGHPAIAGLIERRGEGLVRKQFEPACVVRCIVDLVPAPPQRLPGSEDMRADVLGVPLPRLVLHTAEAGVGGADVLDRVLSAAER